MQIKSIQFAASNNDTAFAKSRKARFAYVIKPERLRAFPRTLSAREDLKDSLLVCFFYLFSVFFAILIALRLHKPASGPMKYCGGVNGDREKGIFIRRKGARVKQFMVLRYQQIRNIRQFQWWMICVEYS